MRYEFRCKISKSQKGAIFDKNGFIFLTLEENNIDQDEYSILCIKEEDIEGIINALENYKR